VDASRDINEPDLESAEFINRLKQRDEAAFRRLVEAFQDRIYNLAMRLTRNAQEAEETLQETLLSVFDKIHTFESRSRLSTWIYAITSNAALSRLRKKSNAAVTFDEEALLNSNWTRNPGIVFQVDNDHDPSGYRELFVMKEIQKLPIKDIADAFGLNPGAVKTRLHRARLLLRARLSDYWEQEREG
jgi:RNA polymerase sigma-70 factor, ECF subfamily